jgi:hypothetical protein
MNVDELLREIAPRDDVVRRHTHGMRDRVLDAARDTANVPRSALVTSLAPQQRRRLLARTLAGVAALAVVVTGVGLVFDGDSPASAQERFESAAAAPAYDTYGAFSAGSTVYIGNHQVTFDEKIKAMYYTSEGVLVRMGEVAYTDAAGPSHYTLIRPDGSHTDIDLRMGDRVPATDPESPNVAYAEPTGDRWSFVVIDLVTGEEVARTTVDGAFTWGGWEAPPVTMAGHRMWALFDDGWMEYDWASGSTRMIPGTKNAPLDAAHGRFGEHDYGETVATIRDFVTGKVLREIPVSKDSFTGFSPDGRYVRVIDDAIAINSSPSPATSRFVDVATGKAVELPGGAFYGWTPDGNTLSVDAKNDRLTVCDPGTGTCDRIDLQIKGSGEVKLGGLPYES